MYGIIKYSTKNEEGYSPALPPSNGLVVNYKWTFGKPQERVIAMTGTISAVVVAVFGIAFFAFLIVSIVWDRVDRRRQRKEAQKRCDLSRQVETAEALVEPVFQTFEIVEDFGCTPREAFANRRVGYYFCPSLLGNCEKEEFAVRALRPSLEKNRWLGVAWASIVDMMIYELKLDRAGGNAPFTAVPVVGGNLVLGAVDLLVSEGLLRVEKVDDKDVVYPTIALVEKVMGKKPVTVS